MPLTPADPATLKFKPGDRVWVLYAPDWRLSATITKSGLTDPYDCGTMITFPPYEIVYDDLAIGPCRALEEKLELMSILDQLAEAARETRV